MLADRAVVPLIKIDQFSNTFSKLDLEMPNMHKCQIWHIIGIFGIWGFGMHMTWQLRHLDIDDPDNCLRLFRANRDCGLIPAASFLLAAILHASL